MPTKIFVGRLAEGTTSDDILALFRKFGTVKECDVISTYGFVHMDTEEEAQAAIAALDGYGVRGSHIHVELSTASTQGRKRKTGDVYRGNGRGGGSSGGRYEPYSPRNDGYADAVPGGRRASVGIPPERSSQREEYASEQVKDLLELYFRDPYAFDQYAKTYYYGERYERLAGKGYDKRPPDGDDGVQPRSSSYSKSDYLTSSSYEQSRSRQAMDPSLIGYSASSRTSVATKGDRDRGMNSSQL